MLLVLTLPMSPFHTTNSLSGTRHPGVAGLLHGQGMKYWIIGRNKVQVRSECQVTRLFSEDRAGLGGRMVFIHDVCHLGLQWPSFVAVFVGQDLQVDVITLEMFVILIIYGLPCLLHIWSVMSLLACS